MAAFIGLGVLCLSSSAGAAFAMNRKEEEEVAIPAEQPEETVEKEEVEVYFKKMGADMPEELWESEDTDKDGFISWEEFTGPKGSSPGGDDDEEEDGDEEDDEDEDEEEDDEEEEEDSTSTGEL